MSETFQASVFGSINFSCAAASYDLWASQFDNTDHSLAYTFGSGKAGEIDYTIELLRIRLTSELPGAALRSTARLELNHTALGDDVKGSSLFVTNVDDEI